MTGVRWTEKDLTDFQRRNRHAAVAAPKIDTSARPFAMPPNQAGHFALGRLKTGEMNKTEAAYAEHLEQQKRRGEILWFKFEALKFRLAVKTFYTPDFMVLTQHSFIELHEVKGFMQEDANVKIKVAASIYPFKFILVRKRKGGWHLEDK